MLDDGGVRRLEPLHWGLVPFWAKDPSVGNQMINARAETLADKNAYKRAFSKRRCIIPADGFYEWKKIPGQKAKQPYVHPPDRRRAVGVRRAVGGLAPNDDGPPTTRPAHLHDHHRRAQRDDGRDPRPHAGDPAAVGVGRRGSTPTIDDLDAARQAARAGAGVADRRCTRSAPT